MISESQERAKRERQARVLAMLNEGRADVPVMASELGVTPMTVYRDMRELRGEESRPSRAKAARDGDDLANRVIGLLTELEGTSYDRWDDLDDSIAEIMSRHVSEQ